MKAAIYSRPPTPEALQLAHQLCLGFQSLGVDLLLHLNLSEQLNIPSIQFGDNDVIEADFIISLGGDGTFLDTVLMTQNGKIPVLGINTGRLGFLATINTDEIDKIPFLLQNAHYDIEFRTLLTLNAEIDIFPGQNFALNDLVVHKSETSSMITIHSYINGEYLNSYWSDGLIISTPTGSTGYSLSCGGPVIMPASNSFAITPVSPHHLNVRPVIVPDNAVISIEVESRGKQFLVSLDARSQLMTQMVQLAVRRAPFDLKMIKIRGKSYLDSLSKKMGWGSDFRN